MKTDIKERRARMIATLEKQFETCQELAETLFDQARKNSDYFHMPIALALLKISGQLSSAVLRMDNASEDELERNSEFDGSIPK